MDFSKINNLGRVNSGAPEDDLLNVERTLEKKLPREYRDFLLTANGLYLDNGLLLYSIADIVEINETLETACYAPGYLAIGNDGGDGAVLISFEKDGVFLVDQGSMDPSDMREVASSFRQWVTAGCPL